MNFIVKYVSSQIYIHIRVRKVLKYEVREEDLSMSCENAQFGGM